jgi:hypothetical protein
MEQCYPFKSSSSTTLGGAGRNSNSGGNLNNVQSQSQRQHHNYSDKSQPSSDHDRGRTSSSSSKSLHSGVSVGTEGSDAVDKNKNHNRSSSDHSSQFFTDNNENDDGNAFCNRDSHGVLLGGSGLNRSVYSIRQRSDGDADDRSLDDGSSSELRPDTTTTTGPSASKNLKHSQQDSNHHDHGHDTLDGDGDCDADSFADESEERSLLFVDESESLYMSRILEDDTYHQRSFGESQSQGTFLMDEHESQQRQRSYSTQFGESDFTFTTNPSNRPDDDPEPLVLPEEDKHNGGTCTYTDTYTDTDLLLEGSHHGSVLGRINASTEQVHDSTRQAQTARASKVEEVPPMASTLEPAPPLLLSALQQVLHHNEERQRGENQSLASGVSLESTDTLVKARVMLQANRAKMAPLLNRYSANRNIYHDQDCEEQEEEGAQKQEEQEQSAVIAVAIDSANADASQFSHLRQVLRICRDENEELLQDGQELFDENEQLTNQVSREIQIAALANKKIDKLSKKIEALEYDLEAAQMHGKHATSGSDNSLNLGNSNNGPLNRSNHSSCSVSSRMSNAVSNAIPAMSRRRSCSQDFFATGTYLGSGSCQRRSSQDFTASSNIGNGTYLGSGSGSGHGQLALTKNSTFGAGGGHSHVHTARRHSTLDTVTWSKDDYKMAYEHSQRELSRQKKLFQQELHKSSDSHTHHKTELHELQDVTHFAVQQHKHTMLEKKKVLKIIKACTNCKPLYTQLLQQQQLDDQERKNALLLKQTLQESKTAVPYSSQQHQQAKLKQQQQLLSSTMAAAVVRHEQQRRESSGVTAAGLISSMVNAGNTNSNKEFAYGGAHQYHCDERTQCVMEPNGGSLGSSNADQLSSTGAMRMCARRMSITFALAKTAEKKEENAPLISSTSSNNKRRSNSNNNAGNSRIAQQPRNGLTPELLQELKVLDSNSDDEVIDENTDDKQGGDVDTSEKNENENRVNCSKINGSSATSSNDKKSNNAGTSKRDSGKPSSTNQRGPRGGLDFKLLQELAAAAGDDDDDNSDTEEPVEKENKARHGNTGTGTQHVRYVSSVLQERKDKGEADETSNHEKDLGVSVSLPAEAAFENVNANVRGSSTKLGLLEAASEITDVDPCTTTSSGTGTAGVNQSLVSAMVSALMTVRQSPPPHETKSNKNQNSNMATATADTANTSISEPLRRPHQLGIDRRTDSFRSNLLRKQVSEKRRSLSSTNDSAKATGNTRTCHDNDSNSSTQPNEEPIVIASGFNIDKQHQNDDDGDDDETTTPSTAATTTGELLQRDKEGGMFLVLPRRTSTGDEHGDGGDGIIPDDMSALTMHTTRRGLQLGLGLANRFRRRGGRRSAPSAAASVSSVPTELDSKGKLFKRHQRQRGRYE